MSRTNNLKVRKEKKVKVKPVVKDPRPKQSDIGKKYKNYGEFRQAVLAWKKRNDKPSVRKDPFERKHGTKSELSKKNEANQKVEEYVQKMKGDKPIRKVDYPSKTVEKPKNVSNEENKKDNQNNEKKVVNNNKLKIKPTTKGGPVKSGVEYARSKGDDLAGFRRTKDTRITKKLKKAGFTEDRLAKLRKDHAEFKANRKKKKKKKS